LNRKSPLCYTLSCAKVNSLFLFSFLPSFRTSLFFFFFFFFVPPALVWIQWLPTYSTAPPPANTPKRFALTLNIDTFSFLLRDDAKVSRALLLVLFSLCQSVFAHFFYFCAYSGLRGNASRRGLRLSSSREQGLPASARQRRCHLRQPSGRRQV